MKLRTFAFLADFLFCLILLLPGTVGAVKYTLTVGALGSGTVTKNPTNASYPSGVTVFVRATPNAGWYFANWSGDRNGSANPLSVVINSNLVITGNFLAIPYYSLTLVTNGEGKIGLNPAGGYYLSNSIVSATATPASGWVFTSWSGSTNTNVNPVSVTLNTSLALTGNFAQIPAFDAQPVSVTNVAGSMVGFSTHAAGNLPLGYQWFFSGGSLTNATNSTLALTNVNVGQAGNYWVIATNNYGSATSSVVALVLTIVPGSKIVVDSPDEASLRAAIQVGDWVSINCNGTFAITNTINITKNVILDAQNVSAIISGGNAVRLFYVSPGVSFSLTNLALANGSCIVTNGAPGTSADAGAIYNDGGNVTLVSCTVTNNSAQSLIDGGLARGGAIFNNGGSVALLQSAVSNNAAIGGGPNNPIFQNSPETGLGGAIYNTNGALTIAGCNVSSNCCNSVCEGLGTGVSMGGAVFQASGSLVVTDSIFKSNLALSANSVFGMPSPVPGPTYGGALAANAGSIVIDTSQFILNTAKGGDAGYHSVAAPALGGAIFSSAALAVKNSTLAGNQVLAGNNTEIPAAGTKGVDGFGGAIYNSGNAGLNGCSVYSNYVQGGWAVAYPSYVANGGNGLGGGIFNKGQFYATNCTIAFNTAGGGSGELNFGPAPFATNGIGLGGGVFNAANGSFTALNLTVASNSCTSPPPNGNANHPTTNGICAGSQLANTNGTLRIQNSVVAGSDPIGNAYGIITDGGYNICSDGSASLNSGASYNFTDPQLAPLASYGGPTLCMALLPNSPAIDNADSLNFPVTDQRGYVRPVGDGPDMGAYESGSYLPGIVKLDITSATNNLLLNYVTVLPGMYRLQASTDLTSWTDVGTNGPFATATNISQSISQQGFNLRYFRLLVQ